MLDILQKATCELCGEEIKWWPEDHGSFSPDYLEAVKNSPDICIAKILDKGENKYTYKTYCTYCCNEIHMTITKPQTS